MSAGAFPARGVSVRPAATGDYEEVRRLKNQIHAMHVAARPDFFKPIAEALPFGLFERWLGAPDRRDGGGPPGAVPAVPRYSLYVAGAGPPGAPAATSAVAGYLLLADATLADDPVYADRRRWVLEELCVDESLRGRGLGGLLFGFAGEEGRRLGYVSLELSVWAWNGAAERFYRSRGMVPRTTRLEKAL
ncbi:MAG: GNAT family N-acetyltransferase [Spirochaetaceae bacterium]|nr:GNAT family N-acetyltransferase [Spirochaetaceae bacterium]